MRGCMRRVQLCGDSKMLDSFFNAAVFLKNLIAESIAAEESLGILSDHLTKRIDVHRSWFQGSSGTIPLERQGRPDGNVGWGDSVFLRRCGCRDRHKRTGRLCAGWSLGFHSYRANAGVWERGAAGHIELGVTDKLPCQVGETGFRHVSLQLVDHDRRGAEQLVMHRTGGTGFVARDLATPTFELKGDRCSIPIF